MTSIADPSRKRVHTINGFCESYGVGRTTTYAEIAGGRLRSVTVGRKRLIPHEFAEEWLEAIKSQSQNNAA